MKKLLILSLLICGVLFLGACWILEKNIDTVANWDTNNILVKSWINKNIKIVFEWYPFLGVCDIATDENFVYFCWERKEYIDKSSFQRIDGRLSKDANNVYIDGNIFEIADWNSIDVLAKTNNWIIRKNQNNIFYNDNKLWHLDVKSFVLLSESYAKDKNWIYRDDSMSPSFVKKMENVDMVSFELEVGENYDAKDKNNYYQFGEIIEEPDKWMIKGVYPTKPETWMEIINGADLVISKIIVNNWKPVDIDKPEMSFYVTIENIWNETANITNKMELTCAWDFSYNPGYTYDWYQSFYSKEPITYDDFILEPNTAFDIKRTWKLYLKWFKIDEIGSIQNWHCFLYENNENPRINRKNNNFYMSFEIKE